MFLDSKPLECIEFVKSIVMKVISIVSQHSKAFIQKKPGKPSQSSEPGRKFKNSTAFQNFKICAVRPKRTGLCKKNS